MTIISTNLDQNGYTTQSDNEIVVVLRDVVVATPIAITNTKSHVHILNQGTLVSYSDAIQLDYTGSSSGSYVENASSGLISGNNGINSVEDENRIFNNGTINANNLGIVLQGDGEYVVNTGTVSAAFFGTGIFVEGLLPTVKNYGTVHGGITVVASAGYTGAIFNSGMVDGDTYAVTVGGAGATVFRNSGKLDGDVASSGSGSFTYDGRKGTINGTITGGTGADRILAGDDGETLGGGKGHDRLIGGLGADTFAFASFSSGDSDVIKRFNVSQDLFQLDHSVFTHLKADAAPAFAIGTTASSPTDFLFYNSGTGGLFYDVDGNGTARSPYLLATLDKGLKLTASNFDVV